MTTIYRATAFLLRGTLPRGGKKNPMIAPIASPVPRCKRPVVLFDHALRAVWTNAPDFPHAGKRPWELCALDDAETCKTSFARIAAGIDVSPLSVCLNLEGAPYRYTVTLANTGCDQLPVIALCQFFDGRLDLLTPRETQVARMTVEGLTAHDIGARLGISASTVDTHRHRTAQKLGLDSLCALGRWAADNLSMEGADHE